ncbi:uncharacterized protein MKK02DRAFT_42421 [Dioszegia hungarica]|uniref:Glucose-methanol-choline oxidoreductase N-terminal domain-containing protein n=1 Tax=Dioszegia hungarica TaxID=4972 RepID=A0AA38LXJ1_9TREE|nr:uncharacterized protein MKK02DRAFT_42421 [Dioszegia hungarica]KAI9638039.1 hypothetical protein MKK02DRAFT_42421 [Dioszegia hungarica]
MSDDTAVSTTQYDVIIIGGGTAGCVIAGRLTEAFPEVSILVIEAGTDSTDDEVVARPLQGMFSALMGAKTAVNFISEVDKHLNGRALPIAAGNTLGGGSAVNFMIYNQAPASDWDDWKQPGWSAKEMQPFIHKSVSYKAEHGDPNKHGKDGRMVVTNGGYTSPKWMEDFFRVVPLTRNTKQLVDMADQEHSDGFGWHAKWIDDKGVRSTSYNSYITKRQLLKPPSNLTILSNTKVHHIIIDHGKAVGVKLVDGTEIKADQQVILSAGGFGSPLIMERSGLGGKEVLGAAGVEVKVDLPGVGKEYRDKQLVLSGYHIDETCETLDSFLSMDMSTITAQLLQYMVDGTGQFATNGLNMGLKWRPTEEEIAELGPDFAAHWKSVAEDKPDKPVATSAFSCQFMGDRSTLPPGKYMAFGWWSNYQASVGSLHISSSDPEAPPHFQSGLLDQSADMPVLVFMYKWTREIARRIAVYRGEYAAGHPAFHPDSAAACKRHDGPITDDAKIVYTKEDNIIIEDWIRSNVVSAWHSMSTCPMADRAEGGVVDAKLDVYGVTGLKIADVSVVPKHMGTNMASVALAIGERCASIVEDELKAQD